MLSRYQTNLLVKNHTCIAW